VDRLIDAPRAPKPKQLGGFADNQLFFMEVDRGTSKHKSVALSKVHASFETLNLFGKK